MKAWLGNTNGFFALALLLALLTAAVAPGWSESDADRLFHEGVGCYLRGDLPAARAALERALAQAPRHDNARRLLGEVNAELQRTAPAAGMPVAAAPVTLAARVAVGEGLVTLGPLPASAPTAVAVPPQLLAPVLTERLVLRAEQVPAGVKALTAIEAYSEQGALKVRLSTTGAVDLMDNKTYQPATVVVDLLGCRNALPARPLAVDAGALVRVRHLRQRTEPLETTRVVLDLTHPVPYTVERVPGGVVITFPNAGAGPAMPLALGEPPALRPSVSHLRPLTAYRVQSHWLRLIAGEKQIGHAGSVLPRPMVVQVTDAAGVPQANVPVWFSVTENNGCFVRAGGETAGSLRVVTDAQGQALAEGYRFATRAGDNVVTAALADGAAGVVFLQTSQPAEAADIVKVHGDDQEGVVGMELDQPLVVEVRDRYANPVAGQRVVFTVLYNDGVADANPDRYGTQSVVVTDEHGRARLDKFKLGTRVGRNQVRASVVVNGGRAARGGLLISAQRRDGEMLERNGEIVRPQAVQEHVPVFVSEMLRDLPGSLDVDAVELLYLDNVTTHALKRELAELAAGDDALRFYDDGNAVYLSPTATGDRAQLDTKLQALAGNRLLRKTVRSVVFTESGRPQLISVDFRDAAVVDVVRTLAEIAGWNIVFPPQGDPLYSQQVTIHLVEVGAKDVLDNILAQAGYGRVENAGIIRIVKRSDMPADVTRIGTGINLDTYEGEENEIITYFIPVKNRKPSELVMVLKSLAGADANMQADDPSGHIVLTDRVANIRRLNAMARLLDASNLELSDDIFIRLITLERASATEVARQLTALYPLIARGSAGATTSFLAEVHSEERGTFLLVSPKSVSAQLLDLIEQFDSGRSYEVITVAQVLPSKLKTLLDVYFGANATQAFDDASRLIISGTPEQIARIREMVTRLDVAGGVTRELVVVALNRITPTDMTGILTKLYPGLANYVAAPAASNTIVVLVPQEQAAEIRAVIEKLDHNLSALNESSLQREVIRLQRLDPELAVTNLQQLYPNAKFFALGQWKTREELVRVEGSTSLRELNVDYYEGLFGILALANSEDMPNIRKVVAAMDLTPFPADFTMKVYSPRYQTTSQLKEWADQIIGTTGQGKIIIDGFGNRLLVFDTQENVSRMLEFFAQMDVSPTEGLMTRSVTLGNISASEMASVLNLIYRGSFIPSTTTGKNMLFVQVPREVMPQVMQTISELDQLTVGETIVVVPLTAEVDVAALESDLKVLFPNLNINSSDWPTPAMIFAGDAALVAKATDVLRELDQPLVTRTFRLTYGEADNVKTLLTDFLSTKGKSQADGRTNSLIVTDVTSNMSRIERIIRDLDRNLTGDGGEGSGTRVFFLKNAQASELVTVLGQVVQATRGDNDLNVLLGTLSADQRTNSILVNSTPANLPLIAALIEQLDRRTPQVFIKTTILEYTLADDENMGFVWNFSDRFGSYNWTSIFNGAVAGPFSLTLTKGQLSVVMDALSSTQRSNILSSPTVMTLNNQAANITIGTTRQQQESRTDPNTGAVTTSFTEKTADLVLDVTPQIGSDRSVKLDFALDLEQFIPTTSATELPTNTRKLTNSVIVADGQTLVVGGIIRDQEDLSRNGVPGIKDIPVLGRLFSSNRNGKQKVELMIFLTPEVVGSPDEGARVTQAYAEQAQMLTPLPVNINTASFDEIMRLPGLQPQDDPQRAGVLASRIIKHREMYGPYQSLEELKFVPGIDDRTFDAIVYRLEHQVKINMISLEGLRNLKGVTLPIAQGIVSWRQQHGTFTDYDTVRRVFIQLGYPTETYDAYLADIIHIGNVVREEAAVTAAATPAPVLPGISAPVPTVRPNPATGATPPPVTAAPAAAGLLNLNTATVEQLRNVGFDEMGARLVIAYRTRYGAFTSVEDLKKVYGVTPEMYLRVKDQVTVGTSGEDNGIMLMPNVPVTPVPQGTAPAEEDNGLQMMPNLPASSGAQSSRTLGGTAAGRLDINAASAEDLNRLPGIDALKAKMIIAYRYTYGEFTSPQQYRNIPYLTADDVTTLTQYTEIR